MIPVELTRIVISETSDQQFIYLTEKNGRRSFPIIIGIFEALEINRKVASIPSRRPMTHDLIRSILETLRTRVARVVVNDLRDGTFFAKLHLVRDGEEVFVDCRPSDAIALASALKTPIFVEDHVMDQVVRGEDDEDAL